MEELFINFLKENDALDKFKKALVIGAEPDIDIYLNQVDPCNFLYASAIWSHLPNGVDYWNGLNRKWKEILQENETNN